MSTCTEVHPDHPDARCVAPGTNHPDHYGYSRAEAEHLTWTNPDYVEPPKKSQTRRGEAEARLAGIAAGVPPRRVGSGTFTKDEGIDAALDSGASEEFREDFLTALYEAARRKSSLTSDDVWDILIERGHPAGFSDYTGSRQSVGGSMSKTAVSRGWLTPTEEKVPPRHTFGHSGLPIRVYRSRVYRSPSEEI